MADRRSTELLGFAPSARVLLVNADDFGMHASINTAVVDSLDRGIVRSTSLMTTCPGSDHAIETLRRRPDISFGIHLTLVRDRPNDQWQPMAPARQVRSLIDRDGRFLLHAAAAELLARARAEEVRTEFRAQLHRVLDHGLRPTHLDFHCLADGGRPDLLEVAMDLATVHGLAVRTWLEPGRSRALAANVPVIDHPFLDSFSLDLKGKADRYEALLRSLPAGLTEWAVHPGTGDGGAPDADPHERQVRLSDYQFLTSERAADVIAEEDIQVIDYRPLQISWRRRRSDSPRLQPQTRLSPAEVRSTAVETT